MIHVGLDIGYAYLKVSGNGENWIQPAVVGDENVNAYETGEKINSVSIEGKTWFIGDSAIDQSTTHHYSLEDDKTNLVSTQILAIAGLAYICNPGDNHLNIATGLPYTYAREQKEKLKCILREIHGKNVTITVDGAQKNCTLYIDNLATFIQGQGIIADYLLDDTGVIQNAELTNLEYLIADIGELTVNYLSFRGTKLIANQSSTSQNGIGKVNRVIAERKKIDHFRANMRIRMGKLDATSELKEQAKRITEEINEKSEHDKYLLAGGGADAIGHWVLPENNNKEILQNSQMSQAFGYEKLAKLTWRNVKTG